jgi:hypothetical protein
MTWLCAKDREVSDSRHLPPLRLAATDLDAILLKTHSLIAAANGPSGEQDSGRETVKLGVRNKEIEIPHFSLASSVAFPREVFRFSYTYNRPDKPISSVTVNLDDYSRRDRAFNRRITRRHNRGRKCRGRRCGVLLCSSGEAQTFGMTVRTLSYS